MKRLTAIIMILLLCLSFAACGSSKTEAPAEETAVQEPVAETAETPQAAVEEPAEAVEAEPEAGADDGAAEAGSMQLPMQIEFTRAEGLSENYVDLENRAFAFNGKVFRLGESTLKDLIDGGLPFDEDDLNNRGNNVNKNYETSSYTVNINEYATLQLRFINITDANQTEENCLLSYVRYYNLYVPQPDYDAERNAKIADCIIDAAGQLGFSFPITLTKEELLENCSEGAVVDEYNNVEYKVPSEVYYGSSGYKFEFNKATNQMEQVYISWLP